MLDIQVSELLGKPGAHVSTHFKDFELPDKHVWVLATIEKGPDVANTPQLADSFFSMVESALVGETYSSLDSLRIKIANDAVYKQIEFSIVVQAEENYLYALVGGGASICVLRQGKLITLLETLRGSASVLSGRARPGDIFIARTVAAQRMFTQKEVETVFNEKKLQSVQALSYRLNSEVHSGAVGLAALLVSHAPVPVVAPPDRVLEVPAHGVRARVAGAIDRLSLKLPQQKIRVQGEENKSKRAKKASLVGFVLLLVLAASVFYGMSQQQKRETKARYEPVLERAEQDLKEAIELAPLSQSRARELILSARGALRELDGQNIEDPRLDSIQSQIKENLGTIAGIYELDAETFFDLSIISGGFEAADMAFSNGLLRVLDSRARRLVGIEVDNKRTEVIAGPDYLTDAIATTGYVDRSFVLSSDGIREVTGEVELVVRSEWDASNVLIAAFAGNIYVLDKAENQIWRYQGVSSGFLEKQAWLSDGYNIDFSGVVSWAIDGTIVTATESGRISVYSLGVPATFSISQLPDAIESISAIYTNDESGYLYVLDPGRQRVVVLQKNGEFVAEYVSDTLANAKSLVVDEDQGLILFLADSRVYSLGLKHAQQRED